MLQFDKLKLVAPLNSTTNHCLKRFKVESKDNETLYYKYRQTSPFSLIILYDILHGESVIEFTSKILLDDYPKMISVETIEQCLKNINNLGLCTVDVEQFMEQSMVYKCDVTHDVIWTDFDSLQSVLSTNLSNHRKWEITPYSKHGIVLCSKTKTRKKRLSIYKKDEELSRATNAQFLKLIKDPTSLKEHFQNTARFELSIGSKEQIRTLLGIEDNYLTSVLRSEANPIAEVFRMAEKIDSCIPPKELSLKDLEKWALVQYCDANGVDLEALVRSVISKNTSVKQTMKSYRKFNTNLPTGIQPIDIYNLIK